jgi:DNA-binding NtrC family response regulator
MPIQELKTLKPIDRPQAPYEFAALTVGQPRLKVLVSETDSPMRNQLVRLLSKDCQVVCAETVRRAARLIQRDHFDLVICDQELPSSGGLALLDFVKLQAPETFVVLAMDEFDARIRSQAILHGALECYVKPMSDEAVRLLILHVRLGLRMNQEGEMNSEPEGEMGGEISRGARSPDKPGR